MWDAAHTYIRTGDYAAAARSNALAAEAARAYFLGSNTWGGPFAAHSLKAVQEFAASPWPPTVQTRLRRLFPSSFSLRLILPVVKPCHRSRAMRMIAGPRETT